MIRFVWAGLLLSLSGCSHEECGGGGGGGSAICDAGFDFASHACEALVDVRHPFESPLPEEMPFVMSCTDTVEAACPSSEDADFLYGFMGCCVVGHTCPGNCLGDGGALSACADAVSRQIALLALDGGLSSVCPD
jgi:hypothetical protein